MSVAGSGTAAPLVRVPETPVKFVPPLVRSCGVGSVGEADDKRRLRELDGIERGRQRIAIQGEARRIREAQGEEEWFETVDRRPRDICSEDELIRIARTAVLDVDVVEASSTHKRMGQRMGSNLNI